MTTKTSYNRILSITTKLNMLLLPYKVSLVIVAVWLDCFWKGCCPFWLIFFSKKNFFCVSKITFILWKLFFMVNFWINLICILQLCNSIGMTFANYMTIKTCIIKDYLQRRQGVPIKIRYPSGLDKTHRRQIISFLTDNGWIGVTWERVKKENRLLCIVLTTVVYTCR